MLVNLLAGGCDLPPIIGVILSEAKDICIPVKAGCPTHRVLCDEWDSAVVSLPQSSP